MDNEDRLEDEKKQLRQHLDDAENQLTKAELVRRSMDGELQRFKIALNDKETETQVTALTSQQTGNRTHRLHDFKAFYVFEN